MWLFTTIGFFSIVQKPGTDFLTVRSRVREDLDNLRERYLPDLSPTIDHAGTDYPYRATVPHAAFASALEKIALDIDYGNYKDEVAARQGSARSHVYGAVWETLFGLSKSKGVRKPRLADLGSKSATAGQALAYGGVVFDPAGLVLLREPKGHYDGYVWTFSKGRPRRGESPEAAALRETLEETGVHARIVSPIPGEFAGGTTVNCYFVMEADAGSGGVAADDKETASICWVAPDEARRRIGLTTNPVGRKRDLDVLAAGLKTRSRGSPPNEDPASKDPGRSTGSSGAAADERCATTPA